jgi:hypothetical protein
MNEFYLSLVLRGLRIYKIDRNSLDTVWLNVCKASKGPGCKVVRFGVRVPRVRPFDRFAKGRKDLFRLRGMQIKESAPNLSTRETSRRKGSYNPKVVRATFKGSPKIGVGGRGCCNSRARGKDYSVAQYIRAN